jgi:hypothetical protein
VRGRFVLPRSLLWLGVLVCAGGCTAQTRVPYTVRSDPPGGLVGVNGTYTTVTPGRIELGVSKTWVGLLHSPDGWAYGDETYTVTVLPPPDSPEPLSAAKAVVTPRDNLGGGELFFDLHQSGAATSTSLSSQERRNTTATGPRPRRPGSY